MSWDFKVGQKVVCVTTQSISLYQAGPVDEFLTVGNIYTIRWVGLHTCPLTNNALSVRLIEVPGNLRTYPMYGEADYPFLACRFRPLVTKKTSIEVFKRLLLPIKELANV